MPRAQRSRPLTSSGSPQRRSTPGWGSIPTQSRPRSAIAAVSRSPYEVVIAASSRARSEWCDRLRSATSAGPWKMKPV